MRILNTDVLREVLGTMRCFPRLRKLQTSYRVPPEVGRYLLPTVRKHPAVLAGHASLLAAACLAASLFTAVTSSGLLVLVIAWGTSFIILLYLLVRVAAWNGTYVVATQARMIFITRLIRPKVVTVPAQEIADLSLHRSWPARLLGYGKLVASPARSGYKIPGMNYMPYPVEIHLEIRKALKLSRDSEDSQELEPEESNGKHGTDRTWLKPL
jgi:hypothetical protein